MAWRGQNGDVSNVNANSAATSFDIHFNCYARFSPIEQTVAGVGAARYTRA